MDTDQHTNRDADRSLTRRDFLKRGSAGLAATAVLGPVRSPAEAASASAPVELTFTFGPDDSGMVQTLIDAFNQIHEGQIHVTWREMPRSSDAYFRALQSEFESDVPEVDVIGADVVWTAELARHGWIAELSRQFYEDYSPDDFLSAALNAASHQFHIWGVPWYTDAGMLFYRRDLLLRNDFTAPPRTWEELKQMARTIRRQEDVRYGFVFQGAESEGGVTNACEYIWNAGGRIMTRRMQIAGAPGQGVLDANVINVNTPEAARGLDIARSMVADGIAPDAVTDFREQDAWEAFLGGDAVFMRNWPFVYGLLDDPNLSALVPEQVSITAIPSADANRRQYSCLGGWNLMIGAHTSPQQRDAAWTFIQFATTPKQQKDRALGGGFLPSLRALYEDPEIMGAVPVIDLGRDAIQNARSRPGSPYYSQMSPHIARAFTRTLRGELTGEAATQQLAKELQAVVAHDR